VSYSCILHGWVHAHSPCPGCNAGRTVATDSVSFGAYKPELTDTAKRLERIEQLLISINSSLDCLVERGNSD
jgi:hypothetical protein